MEQENRASSQSLVWAVYLLAAFFVYRWLTPLIPMPFGALMVANLVSTILFLGIPMAFVYQVGRAGPSAGWAGIALLGSLMLFVGFTVLEKSVAMPMVAFEAVESLRQVSLIAAAASVGLLVSRVVCDPNLLVPVAPVLALVDVITVLTPMGVAKRIMEQKPEVFHAVAVSVPKFGSAAPLAYMGPADILFLAMFFSILHRAGFKPRETFLALMPTLVAYMLIVLIFGWVHVGRFSLESLPALVPMGAVILAVNWRCFTLNRQEKAMSAVLVLGAVAFAVYAFSLPSPN